MKSETGHSTLQWHHAIICPQSTVLGLYIHNNTYTAYFFIITIKEVCMLMSETYVLQYIKAFLYSAL